MIQLTAASGVFMKDVVDILEGLSNNGGLSFELFQL
jgi:hypothetical protein